MNEAPVIIVYVPVVQIDEKTREPIVEAVQIGMTLEHARELRDWLENNLPPRRRQPKPAKKVSP